MLNYPASSQLLGEWRPSTSPSAPRRGGRTRGPRATSPGSLWPQARLPRGGQGRLSPPGRGPHALPRPAHGLRGARSQGPMLPGACAGGGPTRRVPGRGTGPSPSAAATAPRLAWRGGEKSWTGAWAEQGLRLAREWAERGPRRARAWAGRGPQRVWGHQSSLPGAATPQRIGSRRPHPQRATEESRRGRPGDRRPTRRRGTAGAPPGEPG